MKKKLKVFICIVLVISSMLSFTLSTFAVNESEANNTLATADRIYDDANNYGYISSTSDADWWVISFDIDGFANFYLGSIPQSCNYNMHIYKSNGTLIASSTEPYYYSELFRIRVYKNTDYYIKIVSASGTSSTDSYKLRCKVYALQPARIFTVDSNNVWRDGCGILNTRQDAQDIIPSLWSMGYTATEYENNSANAALRVLPSSDIFTVSSHGNSGRMYFNNQTIYASLSTFTENDYAQVQNEMKDLNREIAADELSGLDLAVYACCKTGLSEPYGNLVDITLQKGAYICIGWKQEIRNDIINDWLDKLFDELATGKTVAAAINLANNLVLSQYELTEASKITDIYSGSSELDKLIIGGY